MVKAALNHVDQPTYHERIVQLTSPVCEIAPGVCGPELEAWVAIIKQIRNDQSHQLLKNFGGAEHASYFVATTSCRWILALCILLEIVSPDELRSAVAKSQSCMYALANMDEEHIWDLG